MSQLDEKYLRSLCLMDFQRWDLMLKELEFSEMPEEEKNKKQKLLENERRKAEFHYGLFGTKG